MKSIIQIELVVLVYISKTKKIISKLQSITKQTIPLIKPKKIVQSGIETEKLSSIRWVKIYPHHHYHHYHSTFLKFLGLGT